VEPYRSSVAETLPLFPLGTVLMAVSWVVLRRRGLLTTGRFVAASAAGWYLVAVLGATMLPMWLAWGENAVVPATVEEASDIPTVGVGEATLNTMHGFLLPAGIHEDEFLYETSGSIKLGILYRGWSDRDYFHPFGAVHSAWTQSTEAMTRYAIDVMLRVRDEGRRGVCVPRRELWSAPRILPGYVQRSLSRLPRLYGNWGLPTLDNVLSYRFDARELRFS